MRRPPRHKWSGYVAIRRVRQRGRDRFLHASGKAPAPSWILSKWMRFVLYEIIAPNTIWYDNAVNQRVVPVSLGGIAGYAEAIPSKRH